MQVIETEIPDVKIIIPDVHGDARGWFVETVLCGALRGGLYHGGSRL